MPAWLADALPARALDLHAVMDVTYSGENRRQPSTLEGNAAFRLGQFDFYASQSLDARTRAFVEYVIESDGPEFVVDLERASIEHSFSEALKLAVGRFHTSLGYWNPAYHHGTFFYTPVSRPAFLQFEDDNGVLPVHFVGAVARGSFHGALNPTYYLGVGNGAAIDTSVPPGALTPQSASDVDRHKAVNARLVIEPAAVRGLGLGVSGYVVQDIPALTGGTVLVPDQKIWAGDVTFINRRWELLHEYFLFNDDGRTSRAYYAQWGFRVLPSLRPFVRHERLEVDESDPYFQNLAGGTDYKTSAVGLNFRPGERHVLKAQVDFTKLGGVSPDGYLTYSFQWSFGL